MGARHSEFEEIEGMIEQLLHDRNAAKELSVELESEFKLKELEYRINLKQLSSKLEEQEQRLKQLTEEAEDAKKKAKEATAMLQMETENVDECIQEQIAQASFEGGHTNLRLSVGIIPFIDSRGIGPEHVGTKITIEEVMRQLEPKASFTIPVDWRTRNRWSSKPANTSNKIFWSILAIDSRNVKTTGPPGESLLQCLLRWNGTPHQVGTSVNVESQDSTSEIGAPHKLHSNLNIETQDSTSEIDDPSCREMTADTGPSTSTSAGIPPQDASAHVVTCSSKASEHVDPGISEMELHNLAEKLGNHTNLPRLALKLGFGYATWLRFKASNTRRDGRICIEGTLEMLNDWKKMTQQVSQESLLNEALKSTGFAEFAETTSAHSVCTSRSTKYFPVPASPSAIEFPVSASPYASVIIHDVEGSIL